MAENREAKEAHRRFREFLDTLPALQEHGSLKLSAKNQVTLTPEMRKEADVDNLVQVWGIPELGLLVVAGQHRSAVDHLSFMAEPGD